MNTSMTISPQMRIVALVGVLAIAIAGSAFFFLGGHSHPATVTTPVTQPPTSPPSTPAHVVQPKVDPLFPAPLRAALERDAVVVVGFSNPQNPVSRATIAEARTGASTAHVGFLSVNLLNDSVAGRLTALLPPGQLLPNPGIVIYARPGKLLYRSDGYLDAAAVAQAVNDSR